VRRESNLLVLVLSMFGAVTSVACSLVTNLDGLTGGPDRDAGGADVGGADAGNTGDVAMVADGNAGAVGDTTPVDTASDAPVDVSQACPGGSKLCGGACVDTKSDNGNCGACGNACLTGAGQSCVAGGCAPGAFLIVDSQGYALDDPTGGGAGTGLDQVVYVGPNPNLEWMVSLVSNGQYKILAANGLALTGSTAECSQVVLQSYTAAPEQLWSFDNANGAIVNASSKKVLDDNGGGQGQSVLNCTFNTGNANQVWTLSTVDATPPIPDGTYALVDGAGYALDDPGGGAVDQTHETGPNQRWSVSLVRGIQYKILSASGNALTGATTDAALTSQSYTGADDQLWVFRTDGSGYDVLNVRTGQAIDENLGGLATSVLSYASGAGNSNQIWNLASILPGGSYALFDGVGFALDDPSGGGSGTVPDQSVYSGSDQQWTLTNVSGSLYEIANAGGYALQSGAATGTIAGLTGYTGTGNQLWRFQPADGGYNVINAGTGFLLDASGGGQGTTCVEWQSNSTASQVWTVTATPAALPPIADGVYALFGATGLALDDPDGGSVPPDQVAYSGANQNWTVTLVSGSEYKILGASGYALTSDTTSGALAALSSYTGASNQLWSFAPVGGGTYSVVNAGTGLLLDDNGGGAGTVCNQWGWADTDNQLWTLTVSSAVAPPLAEGVYSFVDAVGLALDDPSSDGGGTVPDQIPYSGAAQNWTVTLVTGFEYEIVGSDGYALTSGTTFGPLATSSTYTGATNQLWSFVPAAGGTYFLVNAGTGLVLDDNGGGVGAGCHQWGWGLGAAPNQNWTVSPR
jgi:hypothetical protein